MKATFRESAWCPATSTFAVLNSESVYQSHLEGLLKWRLPVLTPVFLIHEVWVWPSEFVFLRQDADGLVQGPQLQKHDAAGGLHLNSDLRALSLRNSPELYDS